jgi:mxaA protein
LALAATLAAWLAWWAWRNRRAHSSQPFAVALRQLHDRKLDDSAPEAWHALHRAFDETAGRAIRPETLPVLFERAPQLTPLRALIEKFYAESARRFFANAPTSEPIAIGALCSDLRRIEKRHEP